MRDRRGRSASPKRIGQVLGDFQQEITPETTLAKVQMIWSDTVGDRISAVTEVVDEREGVVTVECSSAVWAQELELMAPRIINRLDDQMDESAPQKLRFRARS